MLRRDGRRRRLRRCKLIFKLISEAKKQRKQNDDDQTHRKLSRALASVYCDARLLGKLIARAGQHGERLKTYSTLRRALASVYRCPLFIVMMVTLGNSTASLRRQHIRADENDVARPWTRECVSADALHSKHSRPCYVVIHELGVMHAYTHTHTHTHTLLHMRVRSPAHTATVHAAACTTASKLARRTSDSPFFPPRVELVDANGVRAPRTSRSVEFALHDSRVNRGVLDQSGPSSTPITAQRGCTRQQHRR
jgi:hypothetical protein